MTIPIEAEFESLTPDAEIELFEIDWSPVLGDPVGTEVNIRRYVGDEYFDRNEQPALDGLTYAPIGIFAENFTIDVDKPLVRPSLTIANPSGVISQAIDALGGDLAGAIVTRHRIFARNLDTGSEPDPLREWPPERYRVDRQTGGGNSSMISFDLTMVIDVPVRLPLRIIDPFACPWRYRDPVTCGWDPTQPGRLFYNTKGELVGTLELDECGLDHKDCHLRFGAQLNKALRHGGLAGVGRISR